MWYLTYLHTNKTKSQNKNSFLIFLIVAPYQKSVVIPGATIRYVIWDDCTFNVTYTDQLSLLKLTACNLYILYCTNINDHYVNEKLSMVVIKCKMQVLYIWIYYTIQLLYEEQTSSFIYLWYP